MDRQQIENLIIQWSAELNIGWDVGYSPIPTTPEERATVTIHADKRRAVIQLAQDIPDSQVEREIVHELLHVMLGGAEDLFDRAASDHQAEAREFLHGQWKRETEWAIESLVDALTETQVGHFGTTPEWETAFPTPEAVNAA